MKLMVVNYCVCLNTGGNVVNNFQSIPIIDYTCMCSYVCGQMVRTAELPKTYPALEGLLAWEHFNMFIYI